MQSYYLSKGKNMYYITMSEMVSRLRDLGLSRTRAALHYIKDKYLVENIHYKNKGRMTLFNEDGYNQFLAIYKYKINNCAKS